MQLGTLPRQKAGVLLARQPASDTPRVAESTVDFERWCTTFHDIRHHVDICLQLNLKGGAPPFMASGIISLQLHLKGGAPPFTASGIMSIYVYSWI